MTINNYLYELAIVTPGARVHAGRTTQQIIKPQTENIIQYSIVKGKSTSGF